MLSGWIIIKLIGKYVFQISMLLINLQYTENKYSYIKYKYWIYVYVYIIIRVYLYTYDT
jgi:hypothetical protein